MTERGRLHERIRERERGGDSMTETGALHERELHEREWGTP